jgi:hypothetical protein
VEFVNFNGNRDAGVGAGSMTLTSGTPFETTSWTPSGSSFGFAGLYLYAPIGYSVSDPIAATLVIAGDPYSIGGGFTGGGTYSDGGMNSVTWSVVPEPSSYATLLGILCLGCAVLRRRRL